MGSTVYLCYEVTQYSELALMLLLALSTSLLHNTKTVLPVSTHLLNNQLQFFILITNVNRCYAFKEKKWLTLLIGNA